MVVKVELVQKQLTQEMHNLHAHVQEDMAGVKTSLNEIKKELERITGKTPHKVLAEEDEMKKGIAEAGDLGEELKVVVAGGENGDGKLNSVEMFDLSTGTWTQLEPMRQLRSRACSVVYNNEVIVTGGVGEHGTMRTMAGLSTNAAHDWQSMSWKKLAVKLPERLYGHRVVVYNGRLIVIGGYDEDKLDTSYSISEVFLVPPFTTRKLANLPQKSFCHGVAIFGDRIVIVGGLKNSLLYSIMNIVVMYDITKNECQELAPLPYSVSEMTTVKWDDNIIIFGGIGIDRKPLNKVLIYNIKTQKCHMLPEMKYARKGCVAAVVKDTVIVMGGKDERGNYLKSVECFRFDRYSWEEVPEMHEARYQATAVIC